MNFKAPITIYNASAGSGKTYTLVQIYLTHLLGSRRPDAYSSFLAITFTNKAVAEMKQRIIEALIAFSDEAIVSNPPDMLVQISEATDLSIETLQRNSKRALKHVLHHYAQ
ncbi:MAG: UvrD-helicase domain-containing protein, partial [Marinirhabdus sp.]|nr:UvrD-helicase domain-containing protein [Marinirhabdus sp.]